MSGYYSALPFVLEAEGGLANHPDDPGGLTNHGVTQATYDIWRHAENLPERSVAEITPDELQRVYHRLYWLLGKCDALPWPLSLVHFDSMVQHGKAPKLLQRALGVTEDGIIGPKTLAAAKAKPAKELAEDLLWVRLDYYRHLDTFPTFGRCWVKRMCDLRKRITS